MASDLPLHWKDLNSLPFVAQANDARIKDMSDTTKRGVILQIVLGALSALVAAIGAYLAINGGGMALFQGGSLTNPIAFGVGAGFIVVGGAILVSSGYFTHRAVKDVKEQSKLLNAVFTSDDLLAAIEDTGSTAEKIAEVLEKVSDEHYTKVLEKAFAFTKQPTKLGEQEKKIIRALAVTAHRIDEKHLNEDNAAFTAALLLQIDDQEFTGEEHCKLIKKLIPLAEIKDPGAVAHHQRALEALEQEDGLDILAWQVSYTKYLLNEGKGKGAIKALEYLKKVSSTARDHFFASIDAEVANQFIKGLNDTHYDTYPEMINRLIASANDMSALSRHPRALTVSEDSDFDKVMSVHTQALEGFFSNHEVEEASNYLSKMTLRAFEAYLPETKGVPQTKEEEEKIQAVAGCVQHLSEVNDLAVHYGKDEVAYLVKYVQNQDLLKDYIGFLIDDEISNIDKYYGQITSQKEFVEQMKDGWKENQPVAFRIRYNELKRAESPSAYLNSLGQELFTAFVAYLREGHPEFLVKRLKEVEPSEVNLLFRVVTELGFEKTKTLLPRFPAVVARLLTEKEGFVRDLFALVDMMEPANQETFVLNADSTVWVPLYLSNPKAKPIPPHETILKTIKTNWQAHQDLAFGIIYAEATKNGVKMEEYLTGLDEACYSTFIQHIIENGLFTIDFLKGMTRIPERLSRIDPKLLEHANVKKLRTIDNYCDAVLFDLVGSQAKKSWIDDTKGEIILNYFKSSSEPSDGAIKVIASRPEIGEKLAKIMDKDTKDLRNTFLNNDGALLERLLSKMPTEEQAKFTTYLAKNESGAMRGLSEGALRNVGGGISTTFQRVLSSHVTQLFKLFCGDEKKAEERITASPLLAALKENKSDYKKFVTENDKISESFRDLVTKLHPLKVEESKGWGFSLFGGK